METSNSIDTSRRRSGIMLWTGRILSSLCILFLLFDGGMKVIGADAYVQGTVDLGFTEQSVQPLGLWLLLGTLLYSLPRTAVFGALLLTAYLGGATAIMVHQSENTFAVFFPILFCVLMWTGLLLRDAMLRGILPVRKGDE